MQFEHGAVSKTHFKQRLFYQKVAMRRQMQNTTPTHQHKCSPYTSNIV